MIRRARWRAALGAALVVVALAGCATIPRSGPVSSGQSLRSADDAFPSFDYLPSGPADGASREAILSGFIEAAVSPQSGYAVARQFLTTSFSSTWKPDAQVLIDSGADRTPTTVDSRTLELDLTPAAYVDDDGGYRRSSSSTPVTQPYRFVKVGGQWRIDKAPDGVVLDESQFANVFSPHTLYFYDPQFAYLVPDQRWFPTRVSTPTRIVNALLDGPSPWLSGAVVSAFPQNTELAVDSVLVTGVAAQVDLDSAADQATSLGLQRMKLQLSSSLADASTIQTVRLSIQGQARQVADLTTDAPIVDPVVDADPLVSTGDRIGFLSGDQVTTLSGVSDRVVPLAPSAFTLSADRRTAAVLAQGTVSVIRDGAAAVRVDDRADLTAPSLDPLGFVWSVPRTAGSSIVVAGAGNAKAELAAPWSSATAVDQLAVSRDGTRLAALIETGAGPHLVVAGIVRGDGGVPQRLGDPIDLGGITGGAGLSIAWIDDLTVDALSSAADGTTTVTDQEVGGEATTGDGPRDGASLAGGASEPTVWARTSAGALVEPRGTGWQTRTTGVGALGVQQGKPGE